MTAAVVRGGARGAIQVTRVLAHVTGVRQEGGLDLAAGGGGGGG